MIDNSARDSDVRRSPIAGPGGRKKARRYALLKEIFFGGTRGGGKADARSASKQHPASFKRQDCTLMAWYRYVYAPRTGGAYDSHHQTAGIAGCTRGCGGRVAARDARAAAWLASSSWRAHDATVGRTVTLAKCAE